MKRLSELLMVGHGAALLLIFNVRANDPSSASSGLKGLAWWFFVGLVAAFACAYFQWVYEVNETRKLGVIETMQERAAKQGETQNALVIAFFISAITFPFGLLSAITFLEPPPAPVVTAPASNTSLPAHGDNTAKQN